MNLKNISQYPTDEVTRLVTFGMQNLDHKDVNVIVMDYEPIDPRDHSGSRGLTDAHFERVTDKYYSCDVYIGIGPEHLFPNDNVVEAPEDPRYHGVPYGGKWEGYIKRQDWKEAMVHIAAHEGWHAQAAKVRTYSACPQDPEGEYAEEAQAEIYAKTIVEKYRTHYGSN